MRLAVTTYPALMICIVPMFDLALRRCAPLVTPHLYMNILISPHCQAGLNKMNGYSCFSNADFYIPLIASLPISAISLLPSLAMVIFVCVLKLHKTLVYRLALYQVLSAMEFSVVWITAAVYCNYMYMNHMPYSYTYNGTTMSMTSNDSMLVDKHAAMFEALLLGSAFIKLMFTVWISIHLFALAVFHKNLQRLEPLYVVSSLLVPMAIATTLLVMNLTPSRWQEACNLREGIVYTIIFAVLIVISLLIIVMGTILCYRACRRRSLALSEYSKQHKKVLYEMLPLLLYPILFLLISTPIFIFAVLHSFNSSGSSIYGIFSICAPLWSFTTSLLLIFHLCVVRYFKKQNLQRIKTALLKIRLYHESEEGSVTLNEATKLCQSSTSDTHFTPPVEE